jgi:hypothetical protein
MADLHLEAIRSGVKYNNDLKALTNSLVGSRKYPRGKVLMAFNRAHRALAGNFDNPAAMEAILNQYRDEVLAAVGEGSLKAYEIGSIHSENLLTSYDLPLTGDDQATMVKEGMASTEALLANQISAIQSGTLSEAQVLGGATRVGMFAAGVITSQAANWFTMMAAQRVQVAVWQSLDRSGRASEFVKQIVAAIDENTTPCCLDAHGQTAEMKDDFHTPEAPAFAEFQQRPPFHRFCRTSQVLVLRSRRNDSLTQDMKMAALLEAELRKGPGYVAPHPANAWTRIRTGRGTVITPKPEIPKAIKAPIGDKHIRFETWDSIADAEKWAEDTYGVTADYQGLSQEQANAVNRGLQKANGVFDLEGLNRIDVGYTGGIAAYRPGTQVMRIDQDLFNNKTIYGGSLAHQAEAIGTAQNRLKNLENIFDEIKAAPELYTDSYVNDVSRKMTELKTFIAKTGSTPRWMVAEEIEDVIVHEMGHHIHHQLEGGYYAGVHGFKSPGELREFGIEWQGSIGERVMNDFYRTHGHKLSQYGSTQGVEYMAESVTAYVVGERSSIHPDLLKVFDEIAIGKPEKGNL